MIYKVSTTGVVSQVPLDDMGERILVHPTVELDLGLEYTDDELLDSDDLQAAIDIGYLIVIEKSEYPVNSVEVEQQFTTYSGAMSIDILDLSDTPVTYSGSQLKYLQVNNTGDGVEFTSISGGDIVITSTLQFAEAPTFNGEINLLGWYKKTNIETISLNSGSPITSSKNGFHSHFIMDVQSVTGAPFTVTVSGTTVNESTGVYSSDSEDITVSGIAYYQTTKSFIDAPEFSIVEGSKLCDMDLYSSTYWDYSNTDFRVIGCRFEWTPDQNNWDFALSIYHIYNDGSYELIDDITFASTDIYLRAGNAETGKYKRSDYDTLVRGSEMEGIVLVFDQRAIGDFYFELRYQSLGVG